MSTEGQAVVGAIGAFATLGGSYLVARFTARQSKHATDTTAELTKEANAISRDMNAVTGLNALVEQLQEEMHGLRDRLTSCERRVADLQRERTRDKSTIRHLIAYARTLIAELKRFGHPIPEAPAGLDHEGGPLA